MKRKTKERLLIAHIAIISLGFFFYFQNNAIVITETTISSTKIPASFEGYKIVQLFDLHSKAFGKNQNTLVQKVNEINPDVIVFTVDSLEFLLSEA